MLFQKPKPLIQRQIIPLILIPPHRIPLLIQSRLPHRPLSTHPTPHEMQRRPAFPNNLTPPTKLRPTHVALEVSTPLIPLDPITATRLRTLLRRARFQFFRACFVFSHFAFGLFCFLGGVELVLGGGGEDARGGIFERGFLRGFERVEGEEVRAGCGLVFAGVAVAF